VVLSYSTGVERARVNSAATSISGEKLRMLRSKTLMVRRAQVCTEASSACTRGCPFERTWSEMEVLTDDIVLIRDNKQSLLVILETTQR